MRASPRRGPFIRLLLDNFSSGCFLGPPKRTTGKHPAASAPSESSAARRLPLFFRTTRPPPLTHRCASLQPNQPLGFTQRSQSTRVTSFRSLTRQESRHSTSLLRSSIVPPGWRSFECFHAGEMVGMKLVDPGVSVALF